MAANNDLLTKLDQCKAATGSDTRTAELLGISKGALSHYRSGKNEPRMKLWRKIEELASQARAPGSRIAMLAASISAGYAAWGGDQTGPNLLIKQVLALSALVLCYMTGAHRPQNQTLSAA